MKKVMKILFTVLLLVFITLYISQSAGYYEYRELKKKVLTEEKIKEFENDVSLGKEIDVNNYLEDTKKDYGNKISKAGLSISNGVENVVQKSINGVFKILESLFVD